MARNLSNSRLREELIPGEDYSHLLPVENHDPTNAGFTDGAVSQTFPMRRLSQQAQRGAYGRLSPDTPDTVGASSSGHEEQSAHLLSELESPFLGETLTHPFPLRTPSQDSSVTRPVPNTNNVNNISGPEQQSKPILIARSHDLSDSSYPVISPALQESLSEDFRSRTQLVKILGKGLVLWLRTIAILILLGIVLWVFWKKPTMSNREKNVFNMLVTAISIALGLNIAAALNEMTLNMRWWYLSRYPRSLQEVDTIIKSDVSEWDTYTVPPRPWAAGIPILWLFVNVASQIGIACLGLSYSIDSQDGFVLLQNGHVNISNFTTFYPYLSTTNYDPDTRFAANNYGNMALLSSPWDSINKAPSPGDALDSVESKIWVNDTTLEQPSSYWQYRFLSSTSAQPFQPGLLPVASVYTNRSINATWQCAAYRVLLPSGNGTYNNITYTANTTTGDTGWLMVPIVQPFETSFWTTDEDMQANRSVGINVFEPSTTSPWLYACNITISNVANSTRPEHKISDKTAQMAASAIAIGGYEVATHDGGSNITRWHRAQRYPQRAWGYGALRNGDAFYMGFNIAHFSIGAISVADKFNPRITLPSDEEPRTGVSLNIPKPRYFVAIFSCVVGLQFILCVGTSLVANRVVVTDDSPIAIARLLEPFVSRLGGAGSTKTGKEMAEALEKDESMRVVYTVHRDLDAKGLVRRRLVLSDEERERAMGDGKFL